MVDPSSASVSVIIPVIWSQFTQDLYQKAIDGKLMSPAPKQKVTARLNNKLRCSISLYGLDPMGNEYYVGDVGLVSVITLPAFDLWGDSYYVVRSCCTKGFIGVFRAEATAGVSHEYQIVPETLVLPNHIGPCPIPSKQMMIPSDSPRVIVGVASSKNSGYYIIREQCWRRNPGSYCLSAGEKTSVSYSTTSGLTSTSSSIEEISAQVGASVSGGWGAVSASVSADLSTSSRNSQELTITQEQTRYYADELNNVGENSVLYLRWQLTDLLTTVHYSTLDHLAKKMTDSIKGRLELPQDPLITSGPWVIDALPDALAKSLPEGIDIKVLQQAVSDNRDRDQSSDLSPGSSSGANSK